MKPASPVLPRWLAGAFALLIAIVSFPAFGQAPATEPPFRVLVFSKTAGYRHASIPAGIAAIRQLGAQHNFTVDANEDAGAFTDANLVQYNVIVFLSTTGDVLDADQRAAFQRYIEHGGGFAGIHAAADTEHDWPWYGGLVGAYFVSHPAIQPATILVTDRSNPASSPLPERWPRTDEWYNFATNPEGAVHVLAWLDEKSYTGGAMGFDHPISWCQKYDGGRSWYTALGHTIESFSEPLFLAHLLGGLRIAAGVVDADFGATVEGRFEKVVLDNNTASPMQLSPAPDGRIFFIERGGAIKVYKPDTKSTVVAGQVAVSTTIEDGLLGIALDPSFASNGWLYLFYSPAGPTPEQHVSRFTVHGDTIDPASEKILLRIRTQRQECCHSGGGLAFGPDGSLYIGPGDNTNPFESNGFDPIDERPGRSPWDSEKSASNTNDLRGKILRIMPMPDGTYTVPAGNLFPPDGSGGRPEIYVMGVRNPFRFTIDARTNWLYFGDVGPDALADDPARGPKGYDEWNQARSAGNYGWPYCIADNEPYRDYDFATGISGPYFDCSAPVNDSPNNTGARQLPAARPSWIWYPYGPSTQFPELGTGNRTAMAGPVYHYDPALASDVKLPAYYDNTLFIYEWSRGWIKEVKIDDAGNILKILPFLPHTTFKRPMDMKVGPDGALYLIEWGSGFSGNNPDAQLDRIEYVHGSRAPVVQARADPTSGGVPLTVHFSSDGSYDPDPGDRISYAWDFSGDGVVDSTDPDPTYTYRVRGDYTARLTLTDLSGKTTVANLPISVGNTAPTLTIEEPPSGSFFQFGDKVAYRVTGSDPEDKVFDGSRVTVQAFLGHDGHAHPLQQYAGCEDVVPTALDPGHDPSQDLFYVLEASYTDHGAPGVAPLTTQAEAILQPRRKQAEFHSSASGTQLAPTADPDGGGQDVAYITGGDRISFKPMNLRGVTSITYRVSSGGLGGHIEVHVDSPDGPKISDAPIAPTGGWGNYTDVTAPVIDPGGTHELFFLFLRNPGDQYLFNLNWIQFDGSSLPSANQGDVNGDCAVTVADAVLALSGATGLVSLTPAQIAAADMNGDGRLDVADVILVLRLAVGL